MYGHPDLTKARARRSRVVLLGATVGCLLLAACGGSSGQTLEPPAATVAETTTSTTSTSTSTTTTSTTTTTTTAPPPPPTTAAPPRATAAPATTARPPAPYTGDPDTFRFPMNGRVYVTLAWDCGGCVASLGSRHHPAVDYKSQDDDTIVASGHGVVVFINSGCASPSQGCGQSMGNSFFLRHTMADGSQIFTFYAHLAEIDPAVTMGACITQGQRVGLMGNSGIGSAAHLHFAFQTSPDILQYTQQSSYLSGSRNPLDFYGTVKVQRCA
jgi:murein DD-endopeptidase MepM/ murein hydrolase activator NlpD